MAENTQKIIVSVESDTSKASGNVKDLNKNLQDTGKAAEKASEDIKTSEGAIKALGGAINIVGGSVELLAGSLAISGAVTEEQAERFEALAVGAIAVADGGKRVLEGAVELSEGLQMLGGTTGLATKATKAFGIATKVAMGPVGIAIAAIGAITAAIVLLKDRFEAVNKVATFFGNIFQKVAEFVGLAATEEEKYRDAQAEASKETERQLKLAQAQGKSQEDLIKLERKLLTEKLNALEKGTEEYKNAENELKVFNAKVISDREKAEEAAREKRRQKIKEDAEKRKKLIEDAEKIVNEAELSLLDDQTRELTQRETKFQEDLAALKAAGFTDFTALTEAYNQDVADINQKYRDAELAAEQEQTDKINAEKQKRIDDLDKFDAFLVVTAEQQRQARLDALTKEYLEIRNTAIANGQDVTELDAAFQAKRTEITEEGIDSRSKAEKFFASEQAEAIGQSLQVATDLVKTFSENIDESTEEGFEKSKKYKIAETRIASFQAAFSAYGSLVGVPFVGPALAVAAAAAAIAAGQKAINDIKSSTFEDSGAPSNPTSGASSGTNIPNISGQFAQGGFLAPGQSTPSIVAPEQPIQAYVLASDVTTGLQAYGQISRRRRFG